MCVSQRFLSFNQIQKNIKNHHSKTSIAWGIGISNKAPPKSILFIGIKMTDCRCSHSEHKQHHSTLVLPEDDAAGTNCIALQAVKQSTESQKILPRIIEKIPPKKTPKQTNPHYNHSGKCVCLCMILFGGLEKLERRKEKKMEEDKKE